MKYQGVYIVLSLLLIAAVAAYVVISRKLIGEQEESK